MTELPDRRHADTGSCFHAPISIARAAILFAFIAGCGLKPVPDHDPEGANAATTPGQSAVGVEGGAGEPMTAEVDSAGVVSGLVPDPSVDELLATAEMALTAAAEQQAAGADQDARASMLEAFSVLRRAETKLLDDSSAPTLLRPAYEKLVAELRDGLASASADTLPALDASAEELARTAELHPSNGVTYEMPIDPEDPLVAKYLALFQQGRRRQYLEQAFRRSDRYREMVLAEIRAAGLPEELWVVPVVESGYKVSAYSRARAVGLWQFMASTARRYGLTVNEWVDERRDPLKSTQAALAYLKDLYLWFNNWDFALAAYNRGEGNIRRDINNSKIADFMQMAELGVTHRETVNHVPQIHAAAIIAKHPEKYGFTLGHDPVEVDTVVIDYVVDLEVAAECAGTTEATLRELNPEIRKWVTPVLSKDYPSYALKLPAGTGERYERQIAQVEDKTPKRQIEYVVRRGDTLGAIGRKFGVSWRNIQRWNNLRSTRIRPGQRLVIMPKRGWPDNTATAKSSSSGAKSAGTASHETSRKPASELADAGTQIYTVRKGDSLYDIAQAFDTTVSSLQRLNGLGRSSRIYPGQKLKVRDGGG